MIIFLQFGQRAGFRQDELVSTMLAGHISENPVKGISASIRMAMLTGFNGGQDKLSLSLCFD